MAEFDDNNHGIQVMYNNDGLTTVEICAHVTSERAISLACLAIMGIADREGIPVNKLLEIVRSLIPDLRKKMPPVGTKH